MLRLHVDARPGRRAALLALVFVLVGATKAAASDGLLPPDAEPYYTRISGTVAKHGWACIYVAGDKKDHSFAYTVGLTGKRMPELLLSTGEDQNVSCTMLNEIAKRLIARHQPVPDGYEPFGRKAVRLNKIYSAEFLDKCPLAGVWVLRHKAMDHFTGMQIVFPDEHGRYPD